MLCESWVGLVVIGLGQERTDSDSLATENSARYACSKILQFSVINNLELPQLQFRGAPGPPALIT